MTTPSNDAPVCRTPHQTVWLEPPDIVVIEGHGEIGAEDMIEVAAFYDQHIRDWPHVFILADQRGQTGMRAEARRVATKVFDWVPFRGTVFFGGSFVLRMVGQLIMTLMDSLRELDNPIMFVETEEQARAWIHERRQHLREKGEIPPSKGERARR
jgi:hypothetical protein